ncbi:hypothetical protein [Burkholderia cenocepacia]|uniref:hypothetical protein n=1 Tax=Burkholderia cenocepacia TaxID=95486 RepID=UPI002ABD4BE4|nr:hypothetical protein [Burkholderia cenocepacia]
MKDEFRTSIVEDANQTRIQRRKRPATVTNVTVRLNPVTWPLNGRSRLLASFIRVAVRFGWVVVVIGPCRSGKSILLDRAMRGATIIDKSALLRRARVFARPAFDMSDVPAGPFAIDEAEAFDRDSLLGGLELLRGRGFAIVFQTVRHIEEMGLSDELRSKHRLITMRLDKHRPDLD